MFQPTLKSLIEFLESMMLMILPNSSILIWAAPLVNQMLESMIILTNTSEKKMRKLILQIPNNIKNTLKLD